MMNTINTKESHLSTGFYSVGTGPENILIIGSCRAIPYANYFHYLNRNNLWTINLINLVNFHFDKAENRVEPEDQIRPLETSKKVLDMIGKTDWFIHEFIGSFGMYSTNRTGAKHIYQFGMAPKIDIGIPNFDNGFILMQELVELDPEIGKLAREYHGIPPDLQNRVREIGEEKMEGFARSCALFSDFPEMETTFRSTWREIRYFWSGTHISNAFTVEIFRLMASRLPDLAPTPGFWNKIKGEDAYAQPRSPITKYDVENYGLKWPQPVEELKL